MPIPPPPPRDAAVSDPSRDAHLAAGHKISKATIYEFGAAFQVCSCGAKIHVFATDNPKGAPR